VVRQGVLKDGRNNWEHGVSLKFAGNERGLKKRGTLNERSAIWIGNCSRNIGIITSKIKGCAFQEVTKSSELRCWGKSRISSRKDRKDVCAKKRGELREKRKNDSLKDPKRIKGGKKKLREVSKCEALW